MTRVDELLTFSVALPQEQYGRNVAQYTFHDAFSTALRQLLGVSAVGASTGLLGQWAVGWMLEIDGASYDDDVWYNVVAPGTFEAFGIPIIGRDLRPPLFRRAKPDRPTHPVPGLVGAADRRRRSRYADA